MHATSLPPVADLLLATCVQSCLQMCVVTASRWFTYVRPQFWECVCTQSDQVQLTCCCCWTGCPSRPQACSWAELHCALYITRAGSCRHQVAAQQHTDRSVGCSICGYTAKPKLGKAGFKRQRRKQQEHSQSWSGLVLHVPSSS